LATLTYDRVRREGKEYHENHVLHLWEVATGEERLAVQVSPQGRDWMKMAFSPDGRTVATAHYEGVIQLWDVVTGKELLRYAGYDADVHGLAFAPDCKTLATGLDDSTILIWDVAAATQRTPPPKRNIAEKEQESLWADLAGANAHKAHVAI